MTNSWVKNFGKKRSNDKQLDKKKKIKYFAKNEFFSFRLLAVCTPFLFLPLKRFELKWILRSVKRQKHPSMNLSFQGEYLAERDKRLQYISGFSGFAGYAVVTKTAAALWTTDQYHSLADHQLDCNWELMKLGDPGVSIWVSISISKKLNLPKVYFYFFV